MADEDDWPPNGPTFERGGFLFDLIEEWSQIAPGYNWRTFHPIMVEVEDDRHLGSVEATIILLGVGFRVRWNYTETEDLKEIKRRVAEIKNDPDAAAVIVRPGREE